MRNAIILMIFSTVYGTAPTSCVEYTRAAYQCVYTPAGISLPPPKSRNGPLHRLPCTPTAVRRRPSTSARDPGDRTWRSRPPAAAPEVCAATQPRGEDGMEEWTRLLRFHAPRAHAVFFRPPRAASCPN